MRIRLHEPAVALTDLAIGVEAGAFAIAVARTGQKAGLAAPAGDAIRRWFVVFFGATSVAAIAGAALHGLLPAGDAPVRRRLWRVSLGSIGVAGLSAWCLGALVALPREAAEPHPARRPGRSCGVPARPRSHGPAVRRRHRDVPARCARARRGVGQPAERSSGGPGRQDRPGRSRPDVRRGSRPGPPDRLPPAAVRPQRHVPHDPGRGHRVLLRVGARVPSGRRTEVRCRARTARPRARHGTRSGSSGRSSAPPGAATSAWRSAPASTTHTATRRRAAPSRERGVVR